MGRGWLELGGAGKALLATRRKRMLADTGNGDGDEGASGMKKREWKLTKIKCGLFRV